MAGIGFELRKLLKRDSLLGMMQAYAYAGIISSGPWVLSIIGILVIGLMSISMVVPEFLITQFQVSVTYLIAFSLTLTGFAQLADPGRLSDTRQAAIARLMDAVTRHPLFESGTGREDVVKKRAEGEGDV